MTAAVQQRLDLGPEAEPINSDHWETPVFVFEALDAALGPFDIDVCAASWNTHCREYITDQPIGEPRIPGAVGIYGDALKLAWTKGKRRLRIWLNPPYSDPAAFLKKAYETSLEGHLVVCLVPAMVGATYWKEYVWGKAEVWFRMGRIAFCIRGENPRGKNANGRQYNALVVYGLQDEPREVEARHQAELARWMRITK